MAEVKEEDKMEEEIDATEDESSEGSLQNDMEEEEDQGSYPEEPLTEKDIEELIAELVEVEGKAAEAQEALEEESLAKIEADVKKELTESLSGDELDKAVAMEMTTFKQEWELELDHLETESAHLLEQLDGAGIELSRLYKWIESQVPNGCTTEAWKSRAHWVGNPIPSDAIESVSKAEEYLKDHRPVRRRHGKILEEGASGFLGKKVATCETSAAATNTMNVDWDSFSKMCRDNSPLEDVTFGNKHWASVYLASTPQQAAELGLKFVGVDEVEEIDDLDGTSSDPFVADAIENERILNLTEEQKKNFRKVKEEEDANVDHKLHIRLKQRRRQRQREEDANVGEISVGNDDTTGKDILNEKASSTRHELYGSLVEEERKSVPDVPSLDELSSLELVNSRGVKRSSECDELQSGDDKNCTTTLPSDDEAQPASLKSKMETTVSGTVFLSSSDSDSDDSDADNANSSTKRRRKKRIRKIIDDAELGEETKKKIAIERERQERLKSLEARFSAESVMMSAVSNCGSFEGTGIEMLGDATAGYIINVVREEGEEAVRIPPSISTKLKPHQVRGIRFMWENIIQSVTKVRSGDKGLGCILAHNMGLGKTFQVIAFLYTAMRGVELGLKTALIVTPVSVIHNWRREFLKWQPCELKPLRILMLEDVTRDQRLKLLRKWATKGGIFLIGYTAFRNLSFGKYVKDRDIAREISCVLQDGPDILVCDEAHIIKNTRADTTQALKLVKCQRRIALTGSPLQNNLMEYYCMVDFVREGFLGSSHEFRNRFQNPIENGQHTNSTAEDVKIMNQRSHILYEQLKGFVQRMDMNVVKKDLPPKTVFVISVKLSPLQRKLYKKFLDVHCFTKDKISGERMIKRSFFAGYQALAQIWNHPGILQLRKESKDFSKCEDVQNGLADDTSSEENVEYNMITGEKIVNPQKRTNEGFLRENWWRDHLLTENNYKDADQGGKMVLLLDILTTCANIGDKALVFSQSILTLDLIELYLSKLPRPRKKVKCWRKGKDWYRLDGRTESGERQKLVERFNEPSNTRVKCTLISTRAGSLGINFHAANRVIIVDGSWNPTHDLQAIYRVWRYGQTKPVFAYRLLAHATMEEKIYKRQVTKEGLAARVVDRQQVHRTMSKEEILHLFEFGEDESVEMAEVGQEIGESNPSGRVGHLLKQNLPLPQGSLPSDKLMESLICKHHPRWILNYHEHETLLQENEDEKLSKEEQDLAWEVYRKTLAWEEVRQVSPEEAAFPEQQKVISRQESELQQEPAEAKVPYERDEQLERVRQRHHCRYRNRVCTDLSHLMILQTQKVKMDGFGICGECAQVVRWEQVSSRRMHESCWSSGFQSSAFDVALPQSS